MRTHAFRLRPGQDLRKEIDNFANAQNIRAGIILTCVGNLSKAVLRMADADIVKTWEGTFEIVSLVGTLESGNSHLHISLSDAAGGVIGGHLKEGSVVGITAEVVIGEVEGMEFSREFDSETGYDELVIKNDRILSLENSPGRRPLSPKDFTQVMGAYSHGLKVDLGTSEMIFVTGQIAMDKDGNAVAPDDIAAQTEFVFQNIQKILQEGGATLNDVVKAVIYITDMAKYKEVSAVRNKYFAEAKPVSTLVEISKTVKEGCDIEIEVIAIRATG